MKAVILIAIGLLVATNQSSSQTLPDPRAAIVDRSKCSATIGAGGNLRTAQGQNLAGKCEGSGESPTLVDSDQGKAIEFAVGGNKGGVKDRSELAFTDRRDRLQYGREYRISFEVNIPDGASTTNDFFYLAQLWQSPTVPPIAGLRVKRGQERAVAIIVRGDGAEPGGKVVANSVLPPDQWVPVSMQVTVKPGDGSCIKASIGSSPDTTWCGPIGYASDKTPLTWYRLKFGIYKGHESGKQFMARFRKVAVAATKS